MTPPRSSALASALTLALCWAGVPSPLSAQLLVAGSETSAIVYFDLDTGQGSLVAQLEPRSGPRALAQDAEGAIYVGLQFGSRNVVKLRDGAGSGDSPSEPFTPSLVSSGPSKIAFDGQGTLLVTSEREATLKRFHAKTGQAEEEWKMASPYNLSGLAVDGGYAYVTRHAEGTIARFDLATGDGVVLARACPQMHRPIALAVGHNGNLYVVNRGQTARHLVQEFDVKTGEFVRSFLNLADLGCAEPCDLVYGNKAYFLASEKGVHEFDMDGKLRRALTHPSLERPSALFVSSFPAPPRLYGYEKAPEQLRQLLESLAASGGDGGKTARRLAELDAEDYATRRRAVSALLNHPALHRPTVESALAKASSDKRIWLNLILDHHDPHQAETMLGGAMKIIAEKRFPGFAPAILAALEGRAPEQPETALRCRRAVLLSLGVGDAPALRAALKSETAIVRDVAARGLVKLIGAEAKPDCLALLADPDETIRFFAALQVVQSGDSAALATFASLLESQHYAMRARANRALKEITGQDFGFSSDFEPEDRKAATEKWAEWIKTHGATAKLAVSGCSKLDLETAKALDDDS